MNIKPWKLLKDRVTAEPSPDGECEFFTPIEDDDIVGLAAWSMFANVLGTEFYGADEEGGCGVTWPSPPMPAMKVALKTANKMQKNLMRQDNASAAQRANLMARVIVDLESYRDFGCSSKSIALEEQKTKALAKPAKKGKKS